METNSSPARLHNRAHKALAAGVRAHGAGAPQTQGAPAPHALRRYQRVAARICELVADSGIGPGERLPSERALAGTLAVSRATLRQALASLELDGIVEVRSFSGLYLCAPLQAAPQAGPGPFALLSARRMIEPELAAMAARVATGASIGAIAAAADAVERVLADQAADNAAYEQADRHFLTALAGATGNAALAWVIEQLWDQCGTLRHTLEPLFEAQALRAQTLVDYRRIVGALTLGDAAAARNAMRAHLARLARILLRG